MRTLFISIMLLFAIGLSAQRHNFAVITGTNVNIRKTPSPNGTLLLQVGEEVIESRFVWSNKLGVDRNVFHLSKDDVVEVVEKRKEWSKIKFYQRYGYTGQINNGREDGYMEGWMSNKYLKPISPVNLTWNNIDTYRHIDTMVPAEYGGKKMLWVIDFIEDSSILTRGQVEGDHITVYGNQNVFPEESTDVKGLKIERRDNYHVILFSKDLGRDEISWLLDFKKLTPTQINEILALIPNTISHYIYIFNVGKRPDGTDIICHTPVPNR